MKKLYLILAIGLVSTFLMACGDVGIGKTMTNEIVVENAYGADAPT